MSVTTDIDEIAEALVQNLVTLGYWGSNVRQVEDPENLPAIDMPFPFALVFDLPTDFEEHNSSQLWMGHQFGIAVFVSAVEAPWAMVGQGQTVGRRAMQKALLDHFQDDDNKTLGGLVHRARIVRHEPGKRANVSGEGDEDPGSIYAVSVLDVKVFGAS